MSAAVGAALKKIAVALLTNKKVLKFIGGTILVILIVILTPIVTIVAILSGEYKIDADRLNDILQNRVEEEQLSELQMIDNKAAAIGNEMIAKGFNPQKAMEAQAIYLTTISKLPDRSETVLMLVDCFVNNDSDEALIAEINAKFGVNIDHEQFTASMQPMRMAYIDTKDFVDPYWKNNTDLVTWAKLAKDKGWGYVWGTYGRVLTEELLHSKIEQYPEGVGDKEDIIRQKWLGKRTVDCVGLIKGYGWFNCDTHEVEYGANEVPDINADQMYEQATEKGPIDTIPELPGVAVHFNGHIGIYIGEGKVIEAKGTDFGVVETELSARPWTHWLKIPFIKYYGENAEETVPEESTVPETTATETEAVTQ